MSASTPVPPSRSDLPEDLPNKAAPPDCHEPPLTAEELAIFIDFFLLLDAWDKKGKIVRVNAYLA
jgi:hypothetical protein